MTEAEQHEKLNLEFLQNLEAQIDAQSRFIPAYTLAQFRKKISQLYKKIPKSDSISCPLLIRKTDNHPTKEIAFVEQDLSLIEASPSAEPVVSDLTDQEVRLEKFMISLKLENLDQVTLYAGPVASAIYISNCRSCTFFLIGHQIRIHDSRSLRLTIWTQTGVLAEGCSDIRTFSLKDEISYDGFNDDCKKANIQGDNLWSFIKYLS